MSDNNGFFRFVWRFNAVLLCFVGVGLLIMQGNLLLEHFDIRLPLVSRPAVDEEPPLAKPQPVYHLAPASVGLGLGHDSERLDMLTRVTSYDDVIPSLAPETGVNVLITDKKAGTSHWMFPGNDRAILSTADVLTKDDSGTGLKVAGTVFVVAEADTNHDGEIGPGDRVTLYVYFHDGKPPRKLFTADHIIPTTEAPVEKWLIYYQDGGSTFAAYYAIPEFKLLTKYPIADMPKLSPLEGDPTVAKIGFTGLDQYME